MLGKIWRQKEKEDAEEEMVRWPHRFDGHEFPQTPNSGRWLRMGKPGVLQVMGSQRVRHSLVTEQQGKRIPTWNWRVGCPEVRGSTNHSPPWCSLQMFDAHSQNWHPLLGQKREYLNKSPYSQFPSLGYSNPLRILAWRGAWQDRGVCKVPRITKSVSWWSNLICMYACTHNYKIPKTKIVMNLAMMTSSFGKKWITWNHSKKIFLILI